MDDSGPASVLSVLLCFLHTLAALAAPFPHSPIARLVFFFTVTGIALAALAWVSPGLGSSLLTPVASSFMVPASPFTPRFVALPIGDEATMWRLAITSIALALSSSSTALLDFRPHLEPPKKQPIHVRVGPTVCTPPRLVWRGIVRGIGYGLVMRKCASSVVAMFLAAITIPQWLSNLAGLLAFVATVAPTLVNRAAAYGVVSSVHLTGAMTAINVTDEAEATLCQTPSPRKKKLWLFGSSDHTPSPPPRPRSPLVSQSPQDNTASTAFSDEEPGSIHVEAAVVEYEDFGSPEHTSSPPRRQLQFVPPSPQVNTVIQHQDINLGRLDLSFSSDGAEGNITDANISCPRLVSLYPALMGMLHETIMHIDENGRLVRRPKVRGIDSGPKNPRQDMGEELVIDDSIPLIQMIANVESKLNDPVDLMREPLPDEYAGANVTLSHIARWDGRTVLTENNMEAYTLADQGYFREPSPPGPSDDTLSVFTEEDECRCGTWVSGIPHFSGRWSPPRRAEERLKRMAADNDEFGLELEDFGKKLEKMRRELEGDEVDPRVSYIKMPRILLNSFGERMVRARRRIDDVKSRHLRSGRSKRRGGGFPQQALRPVPADVCPSPAVREDGPTKRVLLSRTQPTTSTTRVLRPRASVPAKPIGRAPLAPVSTNVPRRQAAPATTQPAGSGSQKVLRSRASASPKAAPAPLPAPKRPTIAAPSRATKVAVPAKVQQPRTSLAIVTPSVATTTARARAVPRASLPAPSAFKVAGSSRRTPTAPAAPVIAPLARPAQASLPALPASKIAPAGPARRTSTLSTLPAPVKARALSRFSLSAPAAAKIAPGPSSRLTSVAPAASFSPSPRPSTTKMWLAIPRPSLPAPPTSKIRTSLTPTTSAPPVTLRPRTSRASTSGLRAPITRHSPA
ncbi:hypothetical protein DXG03_003374 [Asterophora parasitica]|uniref:Uncharacterized protein n=1 Tax=Asterophora parasitica TaxID=117018 RepID=A0A9P7G3N6_9AGAR|nr:hypothetical protein DXG03_003374 [Asterophora parasitica]